MILELQAGMQPQERQKEIYNIGSSGGIHFEPDDARVFL